MLGATFQRRASARAASVTARFSVTATSPEVVVRRRQPIGVCARVRLGCIRAIALSNVRRGSSTLTVVVSGGGANFLAELIMVNFPLMRIKPPMPRPMNTAMYSNLTKRFPAFQAWDQQPQLSVLASAHGAARSGKLLRKKNAYSNSR